MGQVCCLMYASGRWDSYFARDRLLMRFHDAVRASEANGLLWGYGPFYGDSDGRLLYKKETPLWVGVSFAMDL
ncbi:MAG: hypothetical protein PUG91_04670 [Clostridiales bacterium]|nr:hypothetical protein [Clostridiales bacterium]